MFQLWRDLEDLVQTLCVEVIDQWEAANAWLRKIIAMLLILLVLILWMELSFSKDTNFTGVPFVVLSLVTVSIYLILTKVTPLGAIVLLALAKRSSPEKPNQPNGTKEKTEAATEEEIAWFRDAWRKIMKAIFVIYLMEFSLCLVIWLTFWFIPQQHFHPLMFTFFSVVLGWTFAAMIGKAPRSHAVTIPTIVVLVGLLVWASLGDRPPEPPAGFRAGMAIGARIDDRSASTERRVTIPYFVNGYRQVNVPPMGPYTFAGRSNNMDDWVSIACPGDSRGPIRRHGEPLKNPETGLSDSTRCPYSFIIQGKSGGTITLVSVDTATKKELALR